MQASGISLVDANVWLALAVDGHVHHVAATKWFDARSEGSCAFCRLTQLAILRHLTNTKIMARRTYVRKSKRGKCMRCWLRSARGVPWRAAGGQCCIQSSDPSSSSGPEALD